MNDAKPFNLGSITGMGAGDPPERSHQDNINYLRAAVLRDRLLIVRNDLIEVSAKLGDVIECPDRISGTPRREMHTGFIEGYVREINTYLQFFLEDIAKTP